jgi:4-amino-4-deoxy-L-arabinose transferase-like glycosyltransferase
VALRRIPRLAWLCAAVACLNAVCWSLITPPFQVPDEPEHVAYVQDLAGNGNLPVRGNRFSAEEIAALEDLYLPTVAEEPEHQTISSQAQEEKLERDLRRAESSGEKGVGAGVAAAEPPLYYALEAIPYSLGTGGTLLDRIELMRLLSALMAGLTALFSFLFVREALPRAPWAWAVGGLGVALVPLLGFMSGAVTPEAMLYAVTAALFYCLARAFRRGLTRGLAVALGALTAIGLLTKLNFVGIAPGALLGLILLSVRAARTQGRSAYASLAIALAIALSPAALYVVRNLTSGAPALGLIPGAIATVHAPLAEMSYIWQLYLPRLPGMHNDFAGVFTTRQIWFDWYVGLYGWLDTTFPNWVYELALVPAGVILALFLREVVARAGALRGRVAELVTYCVIGVGLMILVGGDSYDRFPAFDAEFGQARYLLPLLPALGAVLVLAARGGGRRWGPAIGAAIIMLFLAHDVFSQLQLVARFYG